jgi:hypothetical protein
VWCEADRLDQRREGTGTRAEKGGSAFSSAAQPQPENGTRNADAPHANGNDGAGAAGARETLPPTLKDFPAGRVLFLIVRGVEWCRKHRLRSVLGFVIVLLTLLDSRHVSKLWYWARYAPPSIIDLRTEPPEPVKGDEVKLYLKDFKNPCNGDVRFRWDEPKSPVFGNSEPFVIYTKSTDPSDLHLSLTVFDDCENKGSIEKMLHLKERDYPNPQIDNAIPGVQAAHWGDQVVFVVVASDPQGNKIIYRWDGPPTALNWRPEEPVATLDTTKLKQESMPYPITVRVKVKNEHSDWGSWEAMPITLLPQQKGTVRRTLVRYITKGANPTGVTQPGNGSPASNPPPSITPAQPGAPGGGSKAEPAPAPHPTSSPGLTPKEGGGQGGGAQLTLRSEASGRRWGDRRGGGEPAARPERELAVSGGERSDAGTASGRARGPRLRAVQ